MNNELEDLIKFLTPIIKSELEAQEKKRTEEDILNENIYRVIFGFLGGVGFSFILTAFLKAFTSC